MKMLKMKTPNTKAFKIFHPAQKNVFWACKIFGYSRDSYNHSNELHDQDGELALRRQEQDLIS